MKKHTKSMIEMDAHSAAEDIFTSFTEKTIKKMAKAASEDIQAGVNHYEEKVAAVRKLVDSEEKVVDILQLFGFSSHSDGEGVEDSIADAISSNSFYIDALDVFHDTFAHRLEQMLAEEVRPLVKFKMKGEDGQKFQVDGYGEAETLRNQGDGKKRGKRGGGRG